MNQQARPTVAQRIALAYATGLGSGYLPFSPGTWGSAVALLLWIGVELIYPMGLIIQICLAAFVFLSGMWATRKSLTLLSSSRFAGNDPQCIVVDEWAGLLIALVAAEFTPGSVLSAFLLFRLFDIWKPGPVRRAEELNGAVGIMADDIMAGLLALIVRLGFEYTLTTF